MGVCSAAASCVDGARPPQQRCGRTPPTQRPRPSAHVLRRTGGRAGRGSSIACHAEDATAAPSVGAGGAKPNRRTALGAGAALLAAAQTGSSAAQGKPPAADKSSPQSGGRRGDSLERFAQQLDSQVVHFTLPNGLAFVVMERPDVPIVSCFTHANVGAFQEAAGQTGVAHLLEHMAFKGTPVIGTADWRLEAPLLEAQEEVFRESRAAAAAGQVSRQRALEERLRELSRQAAAHVVPNEYATIINRAGGVGLNAQTSHDATKYFVSLPSNKLELWFAMEAARWREPVWRQLHSEKDVVLEERRLRVDSQPSGRFFEAFQARAISNNYSRPVIGYEADIRALGRSEIDAFFRRHYRPTSLTVALVGDVTLERAQHLAAKYFGDWNPNFPANFPNNVPLLFAADGRSTLASGDASGAGTLTAQNVASYASASTSAARDPGAQPSSETPLDMSTLSAKPADLDSNGLLEMPSEAGPAANVCYYRPESAPSGPSVALETLADVLTGARTARLYKGLVLTGKALGVSVSGGFPSDKYPCLFVASSVPTRDRSVQTAADDLVALLDVLTQEPVSQAELERVKLNSQVALLKATRSNVRMADVLASYQGSFGDWRALLTELDSLQRVSADDLLSAAQQTFRDDNKFVALMPTL